MWVFPLVLLVVMRIFVFRGHGVPMFGGRGWREREDGARELLDRRRAGGKIGREAYLQMKEELE